LIRQSGGPVGGVADFFDLIGDLAFYGCIGQKQIAVSEDGGKKVLKSCATPLASCPNASMRWERQTCACNCLRVVTSIIGPTSRTAVPRASRTMSARRGYEDNRRRRAGTDIRPTSIRPSRRMLPADYSEQVPDRRMNIAKPKADLFAVVGGSEAEQSCQAVGPDERAGRYIPIPKRIIRSLGNDFKIICIRCRNDFEGCRVLFLRTIFIRFSDSFGVEFRVAVAIAVTAAAARLKKLDLCPRSLPTRLNSLAFAWHRKYGCARSNHREIKLRELRNCVAAKCRAT
jgi:hypothetical protein